MVYDSFPTCSSFATYSNSTNWTFYAPNENQLPISSAKIIRSTAVHSHPLVRVHSLHMRCCPQSHSSNKHLGMQNRRRWNTRLLNSTRWPKNRNTSARPTLLMIQMQKFVLFRTLPPAHSEKDGDRISNKHSLKEVNSSCQAISLSMFVQHFLPVTQNKIGVPIKVKHWRAQVLASADIQHNLWMMIFIAGNGQFPPR